MTTTRDYMAAFRNCTCDLVQTLPGSTPTNRFPAVRIVNCDPECPTHGHLHVDNADPRLSLAANLRYGD